MMTKEQYLLVKLAEEATELANVASKAAIFGIDEMRDLPTTNRERLEKEFADLIGILRMLYSECGIDISADEKRVQAKKIKVNNYMQYSRELGMLEHES